MFPADVGAHAAEFFLNALIAPVQVIDAAYLRGTLGGETDCLTVTTASGDTWYDPAARAALGLDSIDAFEKRNGPRFDDEDKRSLLCLCATGLGRARKEKKA